MSKIVCEICGTTYQDSAASCPICGWMNNAPGVMSEEELDLIQEEPAARPAKAAAHADQKGRAIFDFDAVNNRRKNMQPETVETEEEEADEEEENEEEPRTNTFLVVLLIIVIVALLLATGYMFVRFFLPGRAADDVEETIPVATAEIVETEATEDPTEIPTIPCTDIALPNGIDVLNAEGQNWLLHAVVLPEDTTDEIIYVSDNENVVTVDDSGKVTAVGEGEATITVTCGEKSTTCPVTVRYEAEPETTEPETTAATEETKDPSKKDVTLKLKKTDITLGRYGVYFDLELDCDLKPSEVEWSSSNKLVCDVKDGRVTALGNGIAKITVKYGGQEANCIVRCRF